MILNKLNKEIKIEKSTIELINNRKTKTFVTSFNKAFFSLIQKNNFN